MFALSGLDTAIILSSIVAVIIVGLLAARRQERTAHGCFLASAVVVLCTVRGGMVSVMYTDALQCLMLLARFDSLPPSRGISVLCAIMARCSLAQRETGYMAAPCISQHGSERPDR